MNLLIRSYILFASLLPLTSTFILPTSKRTFLSTTTTTTTTTLYSDKLNINPKEEEYDDDDDDWDDIPLRQNLGIDIGKDLRLTPEEAEELKTEIRSEINAQFATRLDELREMKDGIQRDFEKSKETLAAASELRAQKESEKLMSKIDAMSDAFLSTTRSTREETKMAAEADRGMEGRGLELGSWGVDASGGEVLLGAAAAVTGPALGGAVVSEAMDEQTTSSTSPTPSKPPEQKVLFIADQTNNPESPILQSLSTILQSKSISTSYSSPLQTAPMGGLNAQTAIVLASSLTDRSSLVTILDRIMAKTAPKPGEVSAPPSHIVLVSSLGTTRTDKLPYSMQNFMGGKLSKKRDMEEALVSKIRNLDRPADYTILKIGKVMEKERAGNEEESVRIEPGDALDGDIGIDAAAQILFQSIAYQRSTRNSTFSASGFGRLFEDQSQWNELFLKLDGPELWRYEIPDDVIVMSSDIEKQSDSLTEYVHEWANNVFLKEKSGLTTPVTVESTSRGVKIAFKETNTGRRYTSAKEERKKEEERSDYAKTSSKPKSDKAPVYSTRKARKEGGVEVVIEWMMKTKQMRVRAKRYNMDDDTVIKEISEEFILKRLKEGINFWVKQKQQQ